MSSQTDEGAHLEPAPSPAGANGDGSQPRPTHRASTARSRTAFVRVLVAGVLAVVAILAVALILNRGGAATVFDKPKAEDGRAAFVFPLVKVVPFAVTQRYVTGTARTVANEVRTTLSNFYSLALLEPSVWTSGPADAAWVAFADNVRDQAKADATGFSLGTAGKGFADLVVTKAGLTVRILVDTNGKPTAAQATAQIVATATTKSGPKMAVRAVGTFFLQEIDGHWVISSYPAAYVTVEPAAAPAPGPTAGPSGASPSPAVTS